MLSVRFVVNITYVILFILFASANSSYGIFSVCVLIFIVSDLPSFILFT